MINDKKTAELQLGIAQLRNRLGHAELEIIENSRPWPNRAATYFVIGKGGRRTEIVLTDDFLRDLPATKEYQAATDLYAAAVGGRIKCGQTSQFYCLSGTAVRIEIDWPIEVSAVNGTLSSWLRVEVTDETHKTLARCAAAMERSSYYSNETTFDEVRILINRVRILVDEKALRFYAGESHPPQYQKIGLNRKEAKAGPPQSLSAIEQFLADKVYAMGFSIPDTPGTVWVTDPWDAEYLGVSKKDLSQSAYKLRAMGWVELDQSLSFAKPSDKLIAASGRTGPDSPARNPKPLELSLSGLGKKEALMADVSVVLGQQRDAALLVIDLDHFKQVNDTKGHPEGDLCLERVVAAIGKVLGAKGTLYRWGGDEFAVALPDFSTAEAQATAERIRAAIENARAGGEGVAVTASIGVCATDHATRASDSLFASADKPMYASKTRGKNRVTPWLGEQLPRQSEPTPVSSNVERPDSTDLTAHHLADLISELEDDLHKARAPRIGDVYSRPSSRVWKEYRNRLNIPSDLLSRIGNAYIQIDEWQDIVVSGLNPNMGSMSLNLKVIDLSRDLPTLIGELKKIDALNKLPKLSSDAQQLLLKASEDSAGSIMVVEMNEGLIVQVNKVQFAETGNRKSEARWRQAIHELLRLELAMQPKSDGDMLDVTHAGYEYAGKLRSAGASSSN